MISAAMPCPGISHCSWLKATAQKLTNALTITAVALLLALPIHCATAQTEAGPAEELITSTEIPEDCTFTQGFWKNHPDWPVDELTLGNRTYTKAEMILILNLEPGGNGLLILAHQLIPAKLNVAFGADDFCIDDAIIDADELIGDKVIPPTSGSTDFINPSETSALSTLLDQFNMGNSECGQCERFTNVLIVKTAPSGPLEPGASFQYMITACNDSNTAANDVVVTDTLPSCAMFVSADPPPVNPAANPLRWNLGTLDPSECRTIIVNVEAQCHVNDCVNTATVSTIDPETDYEDNVDTASVTVLDNDPPELFCPPNITLQCPADLTPGPEDFPVGDDNCDPELTITFTDVFTPACGDTGVITRTWTATDDAGNVDTCVQTITIQDTTIPTIDDVPDATVECGGSTAPPATGGPPRADDLCGDVTVTFTDSTPSDLCGNTGVFIRTWKAIDECGNMATSLQTITVRDTTNPTIADVPDATVECGSSTQPPATGGPPAASDTCGNVSVTFSDSTPSDLCGNTGVFVRTWKAMDACGNMATSQQTITVRDTTNPTIGDVPDATVECGNSTQPPATGGPPAASDTCGAVNVTFSDSTPSNLCGNTGVFVRTWRAIDACGNMATSQQTITVRDTTNPTIADVPDATVECGSSTAPGATGGPPAASDTCGDVDVTFSDSTPSDLCGNTGVFVRTWKAIDACGNMATSQQTITIRDTTPPALTCPDDITVPGPTGSETCVEVTYQAIASDTCGNVTVSFTPPSGTCFPCGTVTTVNVTATDACGNTSQCSFTVTVGPCPENGCSLTQGFWKNHPEDWPVDGLTLGTVPYTKAQLLSILNQPVKGNGLVSLAHQLIAAKLNVANEASDSCIAATIAAADLKIGNKPIPPTGNGSLKSKDVNSLVDELDKYNNGLLCIPHCDDLEDLDVSAQNVSDNNTSPESKKAAKQAKKAAKQAAKTAKKAAKNSNN